MTELDELRKPLTQIERAELLDACRAALTPTGVMMVRRLIFEIDSQEAASAQEYGETPKRPCPVCGSGDWSCGH